MNSIMPPSTDSQLDELAQLDHEIPCGYSRHMGDEPAAWAVWYREPLPICGCPGPGFRYICDTCWHQRGRKTGNVRCQRCGRSAPALLDILRIERIRGAA